MNMRQIDERNELLLQIALFGECDLPTFAKAVPKRRRVVRLSLNVWIGFCFLLAVVALVLIMMGVQHGIHI